MTPCMKPFPGIDSGNAASQEGGRRQPTELCSLRAANCQNFSDRSVVNSPFPETVARRIYITLPSLPVLSYTYPPMADFLKSAANYFSSSTLASSNGAGENPLIGTVISVNSLQLRIKRQIGEGLLILSLLSQISRNLILCRWLCFCFYRPRCPKWSRLCFKGNRQITYYL